MNHWPFIIVSYLLTLAGTVGVAIFSYRAMRRAEARADALKERP